MSRLSKKRFIILAIVLIVFITVGMLWIKHFCATHPTHYRFNDEFVIGSTADEIQDRYGDFDRYGLIPSKTWKMTTAGVYNIQKRIDYGFFCQIDKYYIIYFDENGIAVDISLIEGWFGG